MEVNASLVNFAAGVLSKKFLGRIDLPNFYKAGLLTCRNFFPQAQGPAEFRQGAGYVHHTRLNRDAMLFPFVFNDEQAYALEFTDKKLRFLSDGCLIFESTGAISHQLLIHFDGADGATAYTAESGQTVTFGGTAQLDTAQTKFGASSLLLDGNSDYVTVPDNANWNFGSGDFTVDCWVRFNSIAGTQTICGQGIDGNSYWKLTWNATKWQLYVYSGGVLQVGLDIADAGVAINTWFHIALVRSGGTITLYRDGTALTTGSYSSWPEYTSPFCIGAEMYAGPGGRADWFNGWIDEFSVRKGEAVWTANFTPPTAAYSSTNLKAITAITQADPGVITITAHGYSTGDEIYIENIEGMTELNNKFYLVVKIGADTFSLTDVDGNAIDTTAYTAYTAGGTADKIYEIDTPYLEADLKQLQFAQKADVMYIAHPDYEPRKLIRSGDASWALSVYTRTDDPFTKAITGITAANPGVVTATAHGFSDGDIVEIWGVVGMTEVNGNSYKVANKAANTFELTDPTTGANVDTSGYTAYSSAGKAFKESNMPGAVAFYGGRLFFGGTADEPESFWGSKAPTNAGVGQYDVFTVGGSADDGITFPISSQNNTADKIQWFGGTNKFLGIGTYGGVYKANGGSDTTPIAGDAIAVQALEFIGCKAVSPIRLGSSLFYIQRGDLILNRFSYSLLADDFSTSSLNIFSDEITAGGLKQLTVQQGTTDIIWVVTDTGKLLGLTVKTDEEISAWHGPHAIGGSDVKVLSVCGEPQTDNKDSLWLVVERTINGVTRRYIEYIEAEDALPEQEDYYTGVLATDTLQYRKLLYEASKSLIRVDSALTLNQAQTVALTPGAVTGTGIAFTAASDLFAATDVGRYIVRKYVTGEESGKALITAYVSATEVTCTITEDFDSVATIGLGNWFLTATEITGLEHLEGETVRVQIDGADGGEYTVASGAITLADPGTVVHVGLSYTGRITSMPLDIGALVGTAQAKVMTVNRLGLLIRNTMGTKYGTDLYDLDQIPWRDSDETFAIATSELLRTSAELLNLPDGYDRRKFIHIVQDAPFPCTIQGIVPYVDTTNE